MPRGTITALCMCKSLTLNMWSRNTDDKRQETQIEHLEMKITTSETKKCIE